MIINSVSFAIYYHVTPDGEYLNNVRANMTNIHNDVFSAGSTSYTSGSV
jgi:hypothetical protein